MKRFPKILAATCAAVALSASMAFAAEAPAKAQPLPQAAHVGHLQAGPHALGLAGLTPEQQTLAFQLMSDHRAALFPLHQNLYAKRLELEALNATGDGVTAKTRAVIRDIADLQTKMLTLNAEFRAKMFKATGLRVPVMGHGPLGGMGGMMGGGMGGCAMMGQLGQMGPMGPLNAAPQDAPIGPEHAAHE
jgi:Spy/CpxP family protein refolding chaperone